MSKLWKKPEDAPTGVQLLVIGRCGSYFLAEKQPHHERWLAMNGDQFVWVGSDEHGELFEVQPVGWSYLPEYDLLES